MFAFPHFKANKQATHKNVCKHKQPNVQQRISPWKSVAAASFVFKALFSSQTE